MSNQSNKVVAVLDDLFFQVKIADAAKRAGLELQVVHTEDAAVEAASGRPVLMILDLNCARVRPLDLIAKLKNGEPDRPSLLGYSSHVQADLMRRAREAGCDVVIPRSQFSKGISEILKRQSENG